MIIGIDARVLQEGNGGVFVYTKSLLQHLISSSKRHQFKLFTNKYKKKPSKILDELSDYSNVKRYSYRFPNKFLNASLKFTRWPNIDTLIKGCDVLFFPTMMYSAWSKSIPVVITMHDISFEIFPEFFTRRQQIWHNLMNPKSLCHSCTKIISVSESTKRDLVRAYGLEPKKIKVVHSGIDKIFRPILDKDECSRIREKYKLPDVPYIIQEGTIQPRKNYIGTLEAFTFWQSNYSTEASIYHLLLVGHKGWKSAKFLRLVRKSPFNDKIHVISDVATHDLPVLYSLSSVSVFPSFYEGFGFPPLEAMASAVPVIAGANSSIGEIVGDAGLLVDPYRVDDLVTAIRSIVNDEVLAKSLLAKGLTRTVEFNWERTSKDTLRVLESV
jgi:glycosyltransferase involved in cell wall biosynthesis